GIRGASRRCAATRLGRSGSWMLAPHAPLEPAALQVHAVRMVLEARRLALAVEADRHAEEAALATGFARAELGRRGRAALGARRRTALARRATAVGAFGRRRA